MSDEQQTDLELELNDDALLFRDGLDLRKRYTAEQAANIEWKRNAIVMLLGSDWPVEHIARALHVNTRTITAIAAQNAAEVAGATKTFARVCAGLGARWLGLARTKEAEASFLQLVTGAGIAIDKSVILESMGQVADLDVTKGETDRGLVLAELRRRARELEQPAVSTDLVSDAKAPILQGTEGSGSSDAPGDARETARQALEPAAAAEPEGGAGGGTGRPGGTPASCIAQSEDCSKGDPLEPSTGKA